MHLKNKKPSNRHIHEISLGKSPEPVSETIRESSSDRILCRFSSEYLTQMKQDTSRKIRLLGEEMRFNQDIL